MNRIQLLLASAFFLWSCQGKVANENQTKSTLEFQNKGHELVYQMTQKVGSYQDLLDLKDVVYTYTYQTADQKEDISTEKYIFDGEWSYGSYEKHERTLPDMEGTIEQGYNGQSFWLKHNGERVEDEAAIKRVTFNRKTNFYWFAMFQKLLDPGLIYTYMDEATVNGQVYDLVEVSFDTDQPSDLYRLYINKETQLVDQFLFTVVDFNVTDPLIMKVEYEKVDNILIPSKRKYTKANWDGENLTDNWTQVQWTGIKFNNNLPKQLFE
ncbi:hypothetical protein N7E81_17410 [Reichenbachiella carrageenanivorans]|uniref:MORN repeat variant n=1 Tax=Reichenbachiella carrageenanivorans TaxID=2979869 RepID=A0ABY6CZK3_9BACT|nr:DUF6503 family protein [Reichenbachiella carrageenanivorans]UXX79134.1 hypothetical protein N7E81_17410 [Reichenbachiella carrageenanivorans]